MVRVRRSTVIDAPIDVILGNVARFQRPPMSAGIPRWRKAASRRAGGTDEIGCVRRFPPDLRRRAAGAAAPLLSDHDHSFTYCILEAPIPLIDYVAVLRLKPVTDGRRTFWEWSSEFRTPPGEESALAALVGEQIWRGRLRCRRGRLRPDAEPEAAQQHCSTAACRHRRRSRHRRQWHGGRALRRAGGDALGADRAAVPPGPG